MTTRIISPALEELHTLRTPLMDGEQAVLDFFIRTLNPRWEIYIQPHLNGLRPDFVLLNPNVGIAVFEVKSWNLQAMPYRVEYRQQGNPELWATSPQGVDFRVSENPVDKVSLYKKDIVNLYSPIIGTLCEKDSKYFSLVTAGVIITTASTAEITQLFEPFYRHKKLNSAAASYHPLAGQDALANNDLATVFPTAQRYRYQSSKFMQPDIAQTLRSWLVEPNFSQEQRRSLELNKKQLNLVKTRTKSGYRRVRGPAGSGKSLVVAAKAASLSAKQKDILVITFNITLWHYLRDLAVRYPKPGQTLNRCITWLHFHEWCKHVICYEAGMTDEYQALWPNGDLGTILESEMVQLTNRALDHLGDAATHYDAILVDEGQDYNPVWWNTLRRVLRPDGEMLLVADETQDLYERASRWTDEAMEGAGFRGEWSRLGISYRMPSALFPYLTDFANRYLPNMHVNLPVEEEMQDLADDRSSQWPCSLKWIQVAPAKLESRCVQAVLDMPNATLPDITAFTDVILLMPDHQSGLKCERLFNAKQIKTCHVFGEDHKSQKSKKMAFYMGNARIKLCTIHSFKGWESRYLVVGIDPKTDLTSVYVALSRLKRHQGGSYLTVISAHPQLANFGKNWPNHETEIHEDEAYKDKILSEILDML